MTEGRTSAAEANVEAEDRPIDAPAATGTDGAGDVTGTNGHESAGNGTGSHADGDKLEDDKPESEKAESSDSEKTSDKTSEKAEEPEATETVPAATLPGDDPEPASAHSDGDAGGGDATAATGDDDWAEAEDKAYKKELRKGLMFGLAGGVIVGAIVALLLGAFVWPGYLMGPGKPDDTANQVISALSAKDGPALDNLSCKGPDGKPVSQLSGQVLQFIAKVAPAGPATTLIDTEARAPVDVTLSVQGQTQTLPSELVLGESHGDWCLKGLAQRQ